MGRPKGSKNRPKTSLPADLLEELREQEEGFVEIIILFKNFTKATKDVSFHSIVK